MQVWRVRDVKGEAHFSAPLYPTAWSCACLFQDVSEILLKCVKRKPSEVWIGLEPGEGRAFM